MSWLQAPKVVRVEIFAYKSEGSSLRNRHRGRRDIGKGRRQANFILLVVRFQDSSHACIVLYAMKFGVLLVSQCMMEVPGYSGNSPFSDKFRARCLLSCRLLCWCMYTCGLYHLVCKSGQTICFKLKQYILHSDTDGYWLYNKSNYNIHTIR